ncbi:MAG: GvpL/GvpF family gas vesicle protein [Proteobacteria bacterium]|nr:GvpL/GvpF family gas vesicle protein [Pseudomonadota bacterium]
MKAEKIKYNADQGIYLFGFARSVPILSIQGTGVDGRTPLFLHRFSDITAVISSIVLDQFCGPSAESRMQDIAWVGPHAFRHEAVVEEAMRLSPVLPARFGTIFSSLKSLENLLKIHHNKILRFLDHVADKEEWSVKGYIDSKKTKKKLYDQALAGETEGLAALSPGVRYFQTKRIRNKMDKQLNSRLKEVVKGIGEALNTNASDFYQRKLLSRDATGKDMIMNWAYLIPRDSVPDFCVQVDRMNANHHHEGLSLELSGPWPPYSFCPSLEME